MAKEQKRGNREVRKPKQTKAAVTQPVNPFAKSSKVSPGGKDPTGKPGS